jgi:sugar phosphate isomerase/epimerase
MSAARDIAIAYEFHAGTLTDTTESTLELLNATEHPFIKTLWQPPHGRPLPECVESLRSVAHRLQHIHVFHWWPDSSTRHPLCEGGERWTAYVQELRELGRECPLLLEFVCGDALDSFRDDARTLRELCGV